MGSTGLWGAVILSGIYHGVNPGMGWPLAVSAALMKKRHWAMLPALAALAAGHFLAMIAMLLPFSFIKSLLQWDFEIRFGAGVLLVLLGLFLLIYNKHPRFLARIKPTQLGLWSFLIAMAHGAGLMLVPIYLGFTQPETAMHTGHMATGEMISMNVGIALFVSFVHTMAMIFSGAILAVIIYFWVGLKFLSSGWFNMDRIWAISLVFVGLISILTLFWMPGH